MEAKTQISTFIYLDFSLILFFITDVMDLSLHGMQINIKNRQIKWLAPVINYKDVQNYTWTII